MLTQHSYTVQCPLANAGKGGKRTFSLGLQAGLPALPKVAVQRAYTVHVQYWRAVGKPHQQPKVAKGAFVVTAMALAKPVSATTIGSACGHGAAWRNWCFAGASNGSSALRPGTGRIAGLTMVTTKGKCGYGTATNAVLYQLVYKP